MGKIKNMSRQLRALNGEKHLGDQIIVPINLQQLIELQQALEQCQKELNNPTPERLQAVYYNGVDDAREALARFTLIMDHLNSAIVGIHAAAMCSHGKSTHDFVEQSTPILTGAVDMLENVINQSQKSGWPIQLDPGPVSDLVSYAADLRLRAKEYVQADNKDIHDMLKAFVVSENDNYEVIQQSLRDDLKLGRPRDEVKAYLGELAAAHELPKRNRYKIVEDIYNDLLQVPERVRSDKQQDLIDRLSNPEIGYIKGKRCLTHRRREAGVFVTEAHNDYISRVGIIEK